QPPQEEGQRLLQGRTLTGRIHEHTAGSRLAQELEVSLSASLHAPSLCRKLDLIALGRVERPVIDPARPTAGEQKAEAERSRRPDGARGIHHPERVRSVWRRASSVNTRRSGMPRLASSTML